MSLADSLQECKLSIWCLLLHLSYIHYIGSFLGQGKINTHNMKFSRTQINKRIKQTSYGRLKYEMNLKLSSWQFSVCVSEVHTWPRVYRSRKRCSCRFEYQRKKWRDFQISRRQGLLSTEGNPSDTYVQLNNNSATCNT